MLGLCVYETLVRWHGVASRWLSVALDHFIGGGRGRDVEAVDTVRDYEVARAMLVERHKSVTFR